MKRMIIATMIATCSMLNIMASDDDISGAWHGTLKITPQVELKIVSILRQAKMANRQLRLILRIKVHTE